MEKLTYIREAADGMLGVLDKFNGDPSVDRSAVEDALSPLVAHHQEMYERGQDRAAAFMARSKLVYFEPDFTFILSGDDAGKREAAHNHGIWNVLLICSGSMAFRWYKRRDDGSRPGYADLDLVDERVLRAGDVGIVAPPPHDIHEFDILEDDTWLVTAAPGAADRIRQFYDAAAGTYVERPLFGPGADGK